MKRWVDDPRADPAAVSLVRSDLELAPLSRGDLARIEARLERRRAPRWQVRQWALIGAALAGSSFAAVMGYRTRSVPAVVVPAHPAPVAPRPAPVQIDALPIPAPVVPAPPVHHPRHVSADPLVAETRAMSGVLRRLKAADAAGALSELDRYDASFPEGALRREAAVARLDALMGLGRRDDARALLDSLSTQELPRGHELALLKAELDRDCAAFDGFLTQPDLAGRALYGRASCRSSTGDLEGARADLQRYLEQFPDGPRARDAKKALGL